MYSKMPGVGARYRDPQTWGNPGLREMVFPVPHSLKTLVSLSYRNSRQLSMNTVISLLHWVRESTVVQEAVDCPTPGSQRPSERQPTAPFLHLLVSQQSFISPRLPQENRTSGGSKCSPFDLGSNTCWLGDLGHISLTTLHYSSLSAKWGCWVIAPYKAGSMIITTHMLGVDYL